METPRPKHEYGTPTPSHTSLELISRNLYPSRVLNTSSTNTVNSGQGSLTTQRFFPSVSGDNIMAGTKIKFPIFIGNGLEYP